MQVVQNANANYAAAIGRLASNPDLVAGLPALEKQIFDAALSVVEAKGLQIAQDLGQMILDEVSTQIGPEIVQQVSGIAGTVASTAAEVVGEIAPIVAMVMMAVSMANAASEAAEAKDLAECPKLMNKQVIGTGRPGGFVTPSDIFARDPTNYYYQGCPNTALGLFFAAITEGEEGGLNPTKPSSYGSGLYEAFDMPLHHNSLVLHQALPDAWKQVAYIFEPNVDSRRMGIPAETRKVFALLRMAIGSYNVDSGATLMPIYLALLQRQFDQSLMSRGYALYMVGHYWRGSGNYQKGTLDQIVEDVPYTSGFARAGGEDGPGPFCGWSQNGPWTNLFDSQVAPMMAAARKLEPPKKTSIRLFAAQAKGAILSSMLQNPLLTPAARASLEVKAESAGLSPLQIAAASPLGWSAAFSPHFNWSVNACLMLRAYRAQLAKGTAPRPSSLRLPSSTLSHLSSLAGKFGS